MSNIQFIICVSCYILSLVAGLLLMIVGKKASESTFKKALLLHVLIAVVFIIALLIKSFSNSFNISATYFSLTFFCSGVALSGLIFRSKLNVLVKIYFGIFAASFLLFVSSPSTLFSIITKGKLKVENYDRFNIVDNYYLDKQSSFLGNKSSETKYKIVQKLGYFNKTISRDITFQNNLDSIKTLSFIQNKLATLRGYFQAENKTDSADVNVDLSISIQKNEITTKSNNIK
ncbi:MAG: hypothetical protein ABI723_24015 [Bacteroidia bacterium]